MPNKIQVKTTTPNEPPSTQKMEPTVSWFGAPLEPQQLDRKLPDFQSLSNKRLLRAFLGTRLLLGVLLLLGLGTLLLNERAVPAFTVILLLGYTSINFALWFGHQLWPFLSLEKQTQLTVVTDLLFFFVLNQLNHGANLNVTALMALPVLMASVLLRRFLALATAAAATLLDLATSISDVWFGQSSTDILAASSLAGLGFIAIALVVSELSLRLLQEQLSAQENMDLARQQAELNRLVIEEMPEGVLVIDRQGKVRAANPSARQLLSASGKTRSAPFQLHGVPAWVNLITAIEQAFINPSNSLHLQKILLTFDDQTRRRLQMRLKFTKNKTPNLQADLCVIFLEDLQRINARERQDKLAAMGRMSAGIAHEIRNPLAAISQANALLSEDSITLSQQQLCQMVAANVQRLKKIVDDVLAVAPSTRNKGTQINIRHALQETIDQWLALNPELNRQQRIKVNLLGLPPAALEQKPMVCFEPEHFKRVMINLLDNAVQHSSQDIHAVQVNAQCVGQASNALQVMVSVFSDGPAIEANIESALFEPFFSTRSQGTGLGLHICRELCTQNGASIDYRSHAPTQKHRNEFYILMPMTSPTSETT